MCLGQYDHGHRHHHQRKNGSHPPHPFPSPRTHALRILLQLFRRPLPLRARYRMARSADGDWRTMYDSAAYSDLAKLCEHQEQHTGESGHFYLWHDWFLPVLFATASFSVHSLH